MEKLIDSMLAETTQAVHGQSPVLKAAEPLEITVMPSSSSDTPRDHCADGIVSLGIQSDAWLCGASRSRWKR